MLSSTKKFLVACKICDMCICLSLFLWTWNSAIILVFCSFDNRVLLALIKYEGISYFTYRVLHTFPFLYGVINFSPFKKDHVLYMYSSDGLFQAFSSNLFLPSFDISIQSIPPVHHRRYIEIYYFLFSRHVLNILIKITNFEVLQYNLIIVPHIFAFSNFCDPIV